MIAFSVAEFHSDALTLDYSIFFQAAWQIAHGHLDPISTSQGIPFWRDHGEVLMWVLAPLSRLPPAGLWLLIAQDLATVAAEWLAVRLVMDLTAHRSWPDRLPAPMAVAVSAVLLLANPWVYDASAFDFHMQAFAVLALMLAARNLIRFRYRRVFLWAAVALGAGDVAGTYVVGLGLTGVLLARREGRSVRPALAVAGCGVAWTVLLSAIHANFGSGLGTAYGYLAGSPHAELLAIGAGAVGHPSRVLAQLQLNARQLYDAVLPTGVIGLASPWAPIPWLVLLANGLHRGTSFARPGIHQPLPVWPFDVVGTMWVLAWLVRRARLGILAVPLMLAASLGAAVAWLPAYPSTWLRVPAPSAGVLRHWSAAIPERAEVVVTNGIAGRFADRASIFVVVGSEAAIPLSGGPVYFVLSSQVGIEPTPEAVDSVAQAVMRQPGAERLADQAGVTVLRWDPPPRSRALTVG